MKKNGFTLVEILAVLVLVSAIAIIAVPNIINYINQSKNDISEVTEQLIFTGAELYVDNNKSNYKPGFGKQYCITLKDVVDSGYLQAPIIDSVSGEEIDLNKFVQITYEYNNDLEQYISYYDIVDNCENKNYVCKAATEDNKTEAGTIPTTGNYKSGDEYKCDPGDGTIRTFYLLENGSNPVTNSNLEDEQVALIMDYSIIPGEDWINESHYKEKGGNDLSNTDDCESSGICQTTDYGPVTALSSLAEATKNWSKVIEVTLPTYNQLYAVNNSETISASWLYTDLCLDCDMTGYWTSTKYDKFTVYHTLLEDEGSFKIGIRPPNNTGPSQSIRPVIIVNKTNIDN